MALDTFFEEPEEQPEGDDLRAFLREAQDAPTAWGFCRDDQLRALSINLMGR